MLYATTLLISVLVVGAGMTLVGTQVVTRRLQANLADRRQAELVSDAGMEWVFGLAEADSGWRASLQSSSITTFDLGDPGRLTVKCVDEVDADFTNDDTDPVRVTVIRKNQGLRYKTRFYAQSDANPMLAYALAAGANIAFTGPAQVKGGVYALDDIWDTSGQVDVTDEGSFNVPSGSSISGSLQPQDTDAEPITLPLMNMSHYVGLATEINFSSFGGGAYYLTRENLTPTDNTLSGGTNAKGIYVIDIGPFDLKIQECHIKGTLIVLGDGGNEISVKDPVWFEPAAADQPTFLVQAPGGELNLKLPNFVLDEKNPINGTDKVDFNEDGDENDTFDRTIVGLVWTNADLVDMHGSAWKFKGCLIAANIEIRDGVIISHDASLTSQRITGFTDNKLHMIPGSRYEMLPN